MLFDDTGYFNSYNDMLYNIPGFDFGKKYEDSATVEKGFLKGNMFDNEYKPYKNYTYIMPKIKTEKDKDLLKIMESSFAINDYVLWLDLHPNDETILSKYKAWCEKLEMQLKKYEEKYGPLCDNTGNQFSTYKWVEGPWPWEREDAKYV